MNIKSFSAQHDFLLEKLSDVSIFEGDNWNFLKIAQHAFIYSNNDDTSKLLNTRWGKPLWLLKMVFRVKRMLDKGNAENLEFNSTLFLDGGRYATDDVGEKHSVYFEKILAQTEASNRTVIQLAGDTDLDSDYRISKLRSTMGAAVLDKNLAQMIREVKQVVGQFNAGGFTSKEQDYFGSAMQVFIEEYAFYNMLFAGKGVKKCFFCTHYHREGLIAAAHVHGIEMIELQHGLIAENDLYYVYPNYVKQAKKRAFFPDKLLLFGTYWRDVVLRGNERRPEDCIVVGDYSYSVIKPMADKTDVVFIGAQKNMAQPYVDYVISLLKKIEALYPHWKVKLKMHPLEKQVALYQSIIHPQFELIGNEGDLHSLLSECRIQISIYSTTFFDALGLDVMNFSLQNYTEYADYAANMIDENVAFPLDFEEDPIESYTRLISQVKPLLSRESVYAPFDENSLQRILN